MSILTQPLISIMVTGGYGTLGGYVLQVFSDSKVILTGRESLDVTKKEQIIRKVEEHKPDLLIHLAAITNVDLCEKDHVLAMSVNTYGTEKVVDVCKAYNIPLVYISTAAVFDGKNPPPGGYRETDNPHPINFYGETKLLGEKIIKRGLKKFLIVRVGWLIGGGKKEKKFISYITETIRKGESVEVVSDIFGTIAYAKDLIAFIKERMARSEFGLYHFGCLGVCSRFDIANILRLEINKKAKVIPVSYKMFRKEFFAPRPQREILQSMKIPFTEPWALTLRRYIKTELLL